VPDPWSALVYYFEHAAKLQAHDRGLKELLTNAIGGERVAAAKARLRVLVTEVFDRAKAARVLREDVVPFDSPVIMVMLGAVMDRARDVSPELWRRYLTLVLDGLRPDAPTPLPVAPLTFDQLDAVMRTPASVPRR
jgi:hypothetical protein